MDTGRQQELPQAAGSDAANFVAQHRSLKRARTAMAGAPQPTGLSVLERIVRVEVVPRLAMAKIARCAGTPATMAPNDQIEELTKVVLTRDEGAACAYVGSVRAQGMSIECIYLDLITPVARHLGDLWLADVCGFTDVTIGVWRLHQVVRNMSPIFHLDAARAPLQHRALLVPLPGEQHTFGLYMVAEFFRRAGWNVTSMPLQTADELVDIVRCEWFTMVGLSLSCESRLDELASDIRLIRRASRNQAIGVMVGGTIFIERPEMVAQVGADVMATDGRQAPAKARQLATLQAADQQ
jgi:methanogenic corrinoid protein MtbC1